MASQDGISEVAGKPLDGGVGQVLSYSCITNEAPRKKD